MQGKVLGPNGKPFFNERDYMRMVRRQLAKIEASYDAASNSSEAHINHWSNADNLSPDAANSYAVRKDLRSRSRYEIIENNPYLLGTVRSICNDFIGSGPSNKITDSRISIPRKRFLEMKFQRWMRRAKLRYKFIQAKLAKVVDGETFLRAFTNPRIPDAVKLDFQLLECDRVSTEESFTNLTPFSEERGVDGIRFDFYGNPDAYYVLRTHPGAEFQGFRLEGDWVDARGMIHWFRKDRSWSRGIPELTSSLTLCALLRRYTLATVKSAEVASSFAAVLETEMPPSVTAWGDPDDEPDPFDHIPINSSMFTTLPWGTKMSQFDAKQPTAHYDSFVDSLLREIVRPLLTPFNYAAGSSNGANMSSQTIDIDLYRRQTDVDRLQCEEDVIDSIFDMWWREAALIPGYLDGPLPLTQDGQRQKDTTPDFLQENPSLRRFSPDHKWNWDPPTLTHTDPQKVAEAEAVLHDRGILLDRDIQEREYNRSLEEWQEEVISQTQFRERNNIGMSVDNGPEGNSDSTRSSSENL